MNCQTAYQELLIAEPEQLRGLGDTPLAQHIRVCERCGARAGRILEANALLSAQLGQASRDMPKKRRAQMPAWLPIPIAAAIAALIHMSAPEPARAPRVGSLKDVKRPTTRVVVNTPVNRNVAVIRAADNMTVVWDLRAGGGS